MDVDSFGGTLPVQEQVTDTEEEGTIVTLARRQLPEIAPQLKEFEHLTMEQRVLAAEIDRLQEQKDRIDEERTTVATEIREHISTH